MINTVEDFAGSGIKRTSIWICPMRGKSTCGQIDVPLQKTNAISDRKEVLIVQADSTTLDSAVLSGPPE